MNNQETRFFCIGEHYVKVNFLDTKHNNMNLMRSYYPFLVDSAEGHELLFEITIDDDLKPIPKAQRERIREFETGNGSIIVDELEVGGHQFIFKDMQGIECSMFQITPDGKQVKCALTGNYDMRSFGIHNAMMLSYAVAGSFKDTVLIHASLVRQNGYGYAFHAISGTGKSTQVSMWLRFLPGCDLMNDDNPVIRVIDGKPYIYGSPWSGKTPCYRNIKAPLGALTRIDRDDHNWVEPLSPIEAFTSVLPSCSSLKWDVPTYHRVGDTVSKIVQKTKVSILHCLPNREAAEVCNAAIAVK
ncbi:MAG: hypothetical protein J5529_06445 [Prevotella sp.]|nr:hypothetical protein [Prevotella sp.]